MSTAENRALALEFYRLMSKLEFRKMFELLADDATWTVAGKPESFFAAGTQSKAKRAQTFDEFTKVFANLRMNIISSTAEDDRVVLEATTRCETHTGIVYENEFLLLFRCKNNKIVSIYEHCDQQAVFALERAMRG